jgi:hypothetical protein
MWARTEQLTDDVGHRLVCWLEGDEPVRLELPLRRTAAGELLTALEDQGICVFLASEERLLAAKLGRYLSGHGFLRWEDTVEVVAEQPAPLEAAGGRLITTPEIEFARLDFELPAEPALTEEDFGQEKLDEEVRLP